MKKSIFSFLFGISLLSFIQATDTPTSTTVDVTQSTITWKAYKVTGEHAGTIALKSGDLKYKDGQLAGGSFEIDMTSIGVTDLDGKMKSKLEGHLRSPDFFSVEEFPSASLLLTDVKKASKAGEYQVKANLTIKGISKPISFNANTVGGKLMADIKVNRAEFDVRYGSGSFFDNLGDKTIYDEFDLAVALVTSK